MEPPAISTMKMPAGSISRRITRHSRVCVISTAALALAAAMGPLTAFAGMDNTLKAFQQSEFSFARTVSEVPFYPVGWARIIFIRALNSKMSAGCSRRARWWRTL